MDISKLNKPVVSVVPIQELFLRPCNNLLTLLFDKNNFPSCLVSLFSLHLDNIVRPNFLLVAAPGRDGYLLRAAARLREEGQAR